MIGVPEDELGILVVRKSVIVMLGVCLILCLRFTRAQDRYFWSLEARFQSCQRDAKRTAGVVCALSPDIYAKKGIGILLSGPAEGFYIARELDRVKIQAIRRYETPDSLSHI